MRRVLIIIVISCSLILGAYLCIAYADREHLQKESVPFDFQVQAATYKELQHFDDLAKSGVALQPASQEELRQLASGSTEIYVENENNWESWSHLHEATSVAVHKPSYGRTRGLVFFCESDGKIRFNVMQLSDVLGGTVHERWMPMSVEVSKQNTVVVEYVYMSVAQLLLPLILVIFAFFGIIVACGILWKSLRKTFLDVPA